MPLTPHVLRYHRFFALLVLIVVIAGVTAIRALPWTLRPTSVPTMVSVVVFYPAATPDQVESLILHPIEMELREMNDLQDVSGTAVQGVGYVTMTIDPAAPNRDRIVTEIQRAVDRAELPADLPDRPVVRQWSSHQWSPLVVGVSGPDPLALNAGTRLLERALSREPDVARIIRSGGAMRRMEVIVQPAALLRHQIALEDVVAALSRHNINMPGGRLFGGSDAPQEYLLRVSGEFHEPDEVGAVIIRANDRGAHVRIRDVATVAWGAGRSPVTEWVQGERAEILFVQLRPKSDWTSVVPRLREQIADFGRATMSEGLSLVIVQDRAARVEVWQRRATIGAMAVCLLVLLLVMRAISLRSAIVTVLISSLTLCMTLAVLWWSGGTLNQMTLMACVLMVPLNIAAAVHLMVRIEQACRMGSGTVSDAIGRGMQGAAVYHGGAFFAVVALLAPLCVLSNETGVVLRWYAGVVMVGCMISWAIIYTLLPVVSLYLFQRCAGGWWTPRAQGLRAWPSVSRWSLVIAGVVCGLLAVGFPRGLSVSVDPPGEDVLTVHLHAPTAAVTFLPWLRSYASPAQGWTWVTHGVSWPEAHGPETTYGAHLVRIVSRGPRSTELSPATLAKAVAGRPEVQSVASSALPIDHAYLIEVRGHAWDRLSSVGETVQAWIKATPTATLLWSDRMEGTAELRVAVNHARAGRAGISLQQVGTSLRTAMTGHDATHIRTSDEELDVVVRYARADVADVHRWGEVVVGNQQRQLTRLAAIADVEAHAASGIRRRGQWQRLYTVAVTNTDPSALQQALVVWREQFPDLHFSVRPLYARAKEWQRALQGAMGVGLILFCALLYVVTRQQEQWAGVVWGASLLLMGVLGSAVLFGTSVGLAAVAWAAAIGVFSGLPIRRQVAR